MNKAKPPKSAKARKSVPLKSTKVKKAVPDAGRTATATARPAGSEQKLPIQEIVGAIFQKDSTVRAAIAGNMKERSIASKTFTLRANQAFSGFKPSKYAADDRPRRNYLKPGESLKSAQDDVITRGVDAFRKSSASRTMKLAKSAELSKLIKEVPANDDSIVGTIELADILSYVKAKSGGRHFIARDTVMTSCKAEIEAERRIKEILGQDEEEPGKGAGSDKADAKDENDAAGADSDAAHLTSTRMVKSNVDLQMATATSPESQLRYSIPNRSDQMKNIHNSIQTFELRSGPSDVTSFHDFHNLQIAFENVWTELFDDKLSALGKQLYEEYVRLKDFSGVDDGQDLTINTIDDLRKFMDEIRDFSRLTVASIPPELQPKPDTGASGGSVQGNSGNFLDDAVKEVEKVVEKISHLLSGDKYVLTWDSFKSGLPDGDTINVIIEPNSPGIAQNMVEIVIEASDLVTWRKGLVFTEKNGTSFPEIYTQDARKSDSIYLYEYQMEEAKLEFLKEKGPFLGGYKGMYIMGSFNIIKGGTRVTFRWMTDK